MNFTGGSLLLVVGLLVLWLAATGRLAGFVAAWKQIAKDGSLERGTSAPLDFNATPDLRRGLSVYQA